MTCIRSRHCKAFPRWASGKSTDLQTQPYPLFGDRLFLEAEATA